MGAGQSTPPIPKDDNEGEEQFQDASSSYFAPKYSVSLAPRSSSTVRLYKHIGGVGAAGKYVLVAASVPWLFVKLKDRGSGEGEGEDEEEKEKEEEEEGGRKPWLRKREEADGRGGGGEASWHLRLVGRVTARVDERMGVRFNDEQTRLDFIAGDVWAIRFKEATEFSDFGEKWKKCQFENTYGVEDTIENRTKIFGKEFVDWAEGEDGDESMWDAQEHLEEGQEAKREKQKESNHLENADVQETFRVTPKGTGVQSITMGALQNSYIIHGSGIDVYRNRDQGLEATDLSATFGGGGRGGGGGERITPKKGLLMRGESTMMLMAPSREDMMHATGVRQVDLDTEKVVANWQFEKDGTPISMRDIIADSKSAQLESNSSFLGLNDNLLCRWDIRDPHGIVQDLASPSVLSWETGHQFSKGINFTCCASTGSGAIAVGSEDGKVRMYGTTSTNRAKSVFPGAGFGPVTHIDVTYDGKWIVATTDSCVVVLSTVFYDKNGREKTGFEGRMGGKIGASRLLKLNPVDAHRAGNFACFRKAQFSWVTDSDRAERNIVATVGQFSVVWNFRRVKQTEHECYRAAVGGLKTCYCYRVVPREEAIVESLFMHDNFVGSSSTGAPLIVATPEAVTFFDV